MLTLHTLPKRKVFDMTDEPCPHEEVDVALAIEELKTATVH